VTSQGHDYAVFQRALRTGDAAIALAAARDLPHIALDDALRLVLVLDGQALYDRAAVRLLARLTAEHPTISLAHLSAITAALHALQDLDGQHADPRLDELTGALRAAGLHRMPAATTP
jgi:hypothetical protein